VGWGAPDGNGWAGDASVCLRAGRKALDSIARVPYFICPQCRRRSVDHDRREGLTDRAVGCPHCGFGFLFELLDDYYPAPGTGFVVCDRECRVIATGQGVFELTGFREQDVIGQDVMTVFGMNGDDPNPAHVAVEWGVRQLDKHVSLTTRSGVTKPVRVDFFPAYDEDGGLLVALTPT
jgi:DNA-directed RNA polymerase subunit RPC12/RpoP